ncbi:MAG: HEAT repeat domain-containing protein [Armatimonadota bacterium]
MQKLAGAVGLARQGIFPDGIGEKSFLVKTVRKCIATPLSAVTMGTDYDPSYAHLAIIALGYSRSTKALPCLIDLLRTNDMDGWSHAEACVAVARIRSPKAIPVLRNCLKSNDFNALPEAFRALVTLGDNEAIPLAINRITPDIKNYNSGFVVEELTKVTGQRYDYDRQKWTNWWNSVKLNWTIPKEFKRDWDKQEHDY